MNGKSQEKTYRIAIICEGQEEVMYIQSLINLGVFNPRYEIIPALATSGSDDRVGGAGNIPAFFQDYLSKPFDAVFFLLDVDAEPHQAFAGVKKKIELIVGTAGFNRFALYTNPCTLQLMILHFEKTALESQSKIANRSIVHRIWPKIKNYDAAKWQLDEMSYSFTPENYRRMKENAKGFLKEKKEETPSSNVVSFFENLEGDDDRWIKTLIAFLRKLQNQ
jgi:hypothetical protein